MANNTSTIVKNASQAAQQTGGLIPESVIVIGAVIGLIIVVAGGLYLYFNDKKYNYLTRASAWIAEKIGADEEDTGKDMDELKEETENVVENSKDNVNINDPEELYRAIENFGEEKEHAGRQEERKKQRKDENLKDILTVVLLTSGANLLLRLFEMFA